eukprot:84507-Prorocentrum_lima.AAC.1
MERGTREAGCCPPPRPTASQWTLRTPGMIRKVRPARPHPRSHPRRETACQCPTPAAPPSR